MQPGQPVVQKPDLTHEVVIIGGGNAGISVAARLRRADPRLDIARPCRLRRWPDFGRLRGTRDQLALAALLTHGSYSRTRLIEVSRQPAGHVDRFLNACALSGVLHSTSEQVAANDSQGNFVSHSAARLGGLIRGLRSRLGLAS